MDIHTLSRRNFLSAGLAGLATIPLSACGTDVVQQQAGWKPPSAPDDATWRRIREQFITLPGVVYMNNASLGMPPGTVVEAVERGYRRVSQDPIRAKHELGEVIADSTLPGLAAMLGVDAAEIVLTRNATEALHFAATGLRLQRGDHVVMTTQEHPAGRKPWKFRELRDGIRVTEVFIPSPLESPVDVVDRLSGAVSPETKALACCHVTRGGHRYPLKDIAEMAHERGLVFIVDGAQALGMFPIDLGAIGCDAYAASLHKWLLAPMGTGMLYVRKGARGSFRSTWSEVSTVDEPNYAPPGTGDLPLRAAVGTAVEFATEIGLEAIAGRNRYLSNHLKSKLAEMARVTLLSGATDELSAPGSTIFEMEGVDALAAVPAMVNAANIHIDEHQRDGHNAIRISTHYYNTVDEIERLVSELKKL